MKESIVYELKHPFKYAYKGNEQEASFIELKAPTSKNMTECAALKQAFTRALPDNDNATDEDREGKELAEITGKDIMGLILRSKDVELITVLLHARKLFTSGIAQVEGEEKLTRHLAEEMDPDDFEDMTGEYLVNFTLASLLQKMKEA